MDPNTVLLGKMLAEIYRLQKAAGISTATDATIFGLKNGFESEIQEEIDRVGFVSAAKLRTMIDVLEPIWLDAEKLANFKGFYDIERELESGGVSRSDAIKVLTYLSASGQFADIISKMDSSNSPGECRTFKLTTRDV